MTRRLLLLLASAWPWPSIGLAQEPVKLKSDPTSQASRDAAVLQVVLDDLVFRTDSPLRDHKQIFFSPDLSGSRLLGSDDALQRRLKERWKLSPVQLGLAREAAGDAVRRQDEKDAFKGFKSKDNRIILWDEAREAKERTQPRRFRTQVFHMFAPGYSRDYQFAIVYYVTWPLGKHYASGSYGLIGKEGKWVVLYRDDIYGL